MPKYSKAVVEAAMAALGPLPRDPVVTYWEEAESAKKVPKAAAAKAAPKAAAKKGKLSGNEKSSGDSEPP